MGQGLPSSTSWYSGFGEAHGRGPPSVSGGGGQGQTDGWTHRGGRRTETPRLGVCWPVATASPGSLLENLRPSANLLESAFQPDPGGLSAFKFEV